MKSNVTRPSERWNMRPPRGVRENEDYRNSGTGHEINLEIEDVLDKINPEFQKESRRKKSG